ncbi:unnamed protein product [Rangifer tarandus platyrhynchus]|uniref:Uncharacterized protein n=2 Tax=Rangifer tarandus platyrhynchus TaxID=3082113 RepID=A0ABN8YKV7_RANTA|nr:unnamed protein product [Rangifer tarandus platyrhynchus]
MHCPVEALGGPRCYPASPSAVSGVFPSTESGPPSSDWCLDGVHSASCGQVGNQESWPHPPRRGPPQLDMWYRFQRPGQTGPPRMASKPSIQNFAESGSKPSPFQDNEAPHPSTPSQLQSCYRRSG